MHENFNISLAYLTEKATNFQVPKTQYFPEWVAGMQNIAKSQNTFAIDIIQQIADALEKVCD